MNIRWDCFFFFAGDHSAPHRDGLLSSSLLFTFKIYLFIYVCLMYMCIFVGVYKGQNKANIPWS